MVEVLKNKISIDNLFLYNTGKLHLLSNIYKKGLLRSPSPDRSENPFVPGFGAKDCSA